MKEKDAFMKAYAYENRNLAPYQRRELAEDHIYSAIALLQDEIDMQDMYASMDYGTLPTEHYKKAIVMLKNALVSLKKER